MRSSSAKSSRTAAASRASRSMVTRRAPGAIPLASHAVPTPAPVPISPSVPRDAAARVARSVPVSGKHELVKPRDSERLVARATTSGTFITALSRGLRRKRPHAYSFLSRLFYSQGEPSQPSPREFPKHLRLREPIGVLILRRVSRPYLSAKGAGGRPSLVSRSSPRSRETFKDSTELGVVCHND